MCHSTTTPSWRSICSRPRTSGVRATPPSTSAPMSSSWSVGCCSGCRSSASTRPAGGRRTGAGSPWSPWACRSAPPSPRSTAAGRCSPPLRWQPCSGSAWLSPDAATESLARRAAAPGRWSRRCRRCGCERAAVKGRPGSIDELQQRLADNAYLADRGLATGVFLALSLGQPLLVEGEAGVGKTELAKAMAAVLGVQLIRLQCYEGIDANQALYDWDYARQLVYLRTLQGPGDAGDVFSERFLVERPLLAALRAGDRAVLLIDEIDRADEEFEAFLLELLSDFQVTIPEIGPVRATRPPFVVLTSNRTRELHDALRRRCLYHWIEYPDLDREVEIVRARAPEIEASLAVDVSTATGRLRELDLVKRPGVAETIGWAKALAVLGRQLDASSAADTIGMVVKDHDDVQVVTERLDWVVDGDG